MAASAAVILSVWAAVLDSIVSQIVVQEANVGSTAVLPCRSNDDHHRFQFWELEGNQLFGPGNAADTAKYKFEVLTGTLYIKSVSTAEAGFYKCFSRGLTNSSFATHSIELIVKKDWEDVWETDTETNVYRVLVAVAALILLLGLAFFVYRFIKRRRASRFGDMSDEESPDEAVTHGASYNVSNPPSVTPTNIPNSQGVDNPALETDFPKVFKVLQTTSHSPM